MNNNPNLSEFKLLGITMSKPNLLVLSAITTTTVAYLYFATDGYAQNAWNLQLEPMYLEVGGANVLHSQTITQTYPADSTNSFPSAYIQQKFEFDGNITFRGQLEYMPEEWGIGVSGWWFDTSDTLGQNLTIPSTPNYTTFSYTTYDSINTSASFGPDGGTLKTSAKSKLNLWNVDVYGIKSLCKFNYGQINLTFGAKFGGINNRTSELMQSENNFGDINLSRSESSSRSSNANILVGPSVGFQTLGDYGTHHLQGLLNQAILIGNVNRNQNYSGVAYWNSPYTLFSDYNSFADNSDYSETLVIPVTDIKIKYSYDLTENLSLGLGVFASIWVNTPTSNGNNVYTLSAESGAHTNYKTLVFYGGLSSINLKF